MPRHRRGWASNIDNNVEMRHSPLTISLLEPVLLILLSEQEGHGYTLIGDLETFGMGTIHPSVVYRTLRELEGLGWIQSDWNVETTQGPPRRNYQLTLLGQDALRNWKLELERTNNLITKLIPRIIE